MKTIEEISEIKNHHAVVHAKCLRKEKNGILADLRGANLCSADLSGVNLCYADLSGAEVPDNWIKNKKFLTPDMALSLENTEQRRAACEILKWHNILEHQSQ